MADVQDHLESPALWRLNEGQKRSGFMPGGPRGLRNRPRRGGVPGLNGVIEAEIIPRLVGAHSRARQAAASFPAVLRQAPASEQIAAVAEKALADDVQGICAWVEKLRVEGRSLEWIYTQLLARAASHLQCMWSEDLCGFADVTLALWRLQQVLREYSVAFQAAARRPDTGHRALLVPAPREKHDLSFVMFGLVMMSQFLRRDGWEAWIEPDASTPEFTAVVCSQWFDVVEFLVSGDRQLDALAAGIRSIRRDSPNKSIGIIVCGQVFIEHPELVLLLGADLTAADAGQGAQKAEGLVRLTASAYAVR
jgi:MerR family transcriptional regulator, light-induced transcriptional regulator